MKEEKKIEKRLMIIFKSVALEIIRPILLFLILFLPLFFVLATTELSLKFVYELPPDIGIVYISLFLFAIGAFIHYFFGKYGTAYKLSFMILVRDLEKLLYNHQEINEAIPEIEQALISNLIGDIIVIISLLEILISSPSVLSKIVVSIIVALLSFYIITNKKYENFISLVKKIWR